MTYHQAWIKTSSSPEVDTWLWDPINGHNIVGTVLSVYMLKHYNIGHINEHITL